MYKLCNNGMRNFVSKTLSKITRNININISVLEGCLDGSLKRVGNKMSDFKFEILLRLFEASPGFINVVLL